MNAPTFQELNVGDSLRLSLEGSFDRQVPREREFESLFQSLERNAGGWMPTAIAGKRQRKYSRSSVWKA